MHTQCLSACAPVARHHEQTGSFRRRAVFRREHSLYGIAFRKRSAFQSRRKQLVSCASRDGEFIHTDSPLDLNGGIQWLGEQSRSAAVVRQQGCTLGFWMRWPPMIKSLTSGHCPASALGSGSFIINSIETKSKTK